MVNMKEHTKQFGGIIQLKSTRIYLNFFYTLNLKSFIGSQIAASCCAKTEA